MVEHKSAEITEDEAALYDRQIRLWGLDAQKRLRAARLLLIGVSGLGAEIAKNIVLSGVKSVTLMDDKKVTGDDFCSQFLASRDDLGKNRAESSLFRTRQLNPMVDVTADTESVDTKDDDYFKNFDVICATSITKDQLLRLNDLCHKENIMFYSADVFGYYGYMFADLNNHEYAEEIQKKVEEESGSGEPAAKKSKTETETVTVRKTAAFCRLKDAFAVDWTTNDMTKRLKRTPNTYFILRILLEFRSKFNRDPSDAYENEDKKALNEIRESILDELKVKREIVPEDFANYCLDELSPVCAVVGGVVGQEIIKAVSQKDPPHNNFFFYNGVDGNGMVDKIG